MDYRLENDIIRQKISRLLRTVRSVHGDQYLRWVLVILVVLAGGQSAQQGRTPDAFNDGGIQP